MNDEPYQFLLLFVLFASSIHNDNKLLLIAQSFSEENYFYLGTYRLPYPGH